MTGKCTVLEFTSALSLPEGTRKREYKEGHRKMPLPMGLLEPRTFWNSALAFKVLFSIIKYLAKKRLRLPDFH